MKEVDSVKERVERMAYKKLFRLGQEVEGMAKQLDAVGIQPKLAEKLRKQAREMWAAVPDSVLNGWVVMEGRNDPETLARKAKKKNSKR